MSVVPWDEWIEEVKEIARFELNYPEDCEWDEFRAYYDDGYCPRDAVIEDWSYADLDFC